MGTGGRSRNAPCFCGSGRKLKHCCLRSLTPVRTWKSAEGRCRWRFWRAHAAHDRYASEVAEHVCNGERVWIARGTDIGTTWTIDKDPATLLEVLDHLPAALYDWVFNQTMTALNDSAPATEHNTREPSASPRPDETLVLGEIHHLMLEVLRLAHASDALEGHLPLNLRPDERATLKLRDRAWTQLAS
ncbi:MAG: SEC-C domain-containing protein [Actinobacteria bacterium]|nr:SEC-C domain-containing protein [Actinomycetota bacterium]